MHSLSPAEVVEAFGQCARALDEDGARALSVGWDEPGDAPRRLYKQAAAGRWQLRVLGPAQVMNDRAVQQLTLYWPERKKTVGAVWAHLIEVPDEGWRLAGAQDDIRLAGLFVAGQTPPVLTASQLPRSEAVEAWGAALLEELGADVLRSAGAVRDTWDLPVIGHVPPFASSEDRAPSLKGTPADHPALAAHARLRDALAAHPQLVFLSSVAGEGKSTLAANLAYARGLMGQRVALVDGDLRLPRVWRRWGVDAGPGLCECVDGLDPLAALQASGEAGVSLLAAGRAPADPLPVLREAGPVLRAVAESVDSVIIDGAPGIEFDDAFVLAEVAEAPLVVVVELGKTRASTLAELRARCAAMGVQPLGLVLNRTPVDATGALREYAEGEGVEMQLLGSRWLEAIGRGAVGLHFGRPGERGRTEWVVVERDGEGLVQVGRSKVLTLGALLQGAEIAGPEAHGREWRSEQVTRAFARAVDDNLERVRELGGAQAEEPAAAFARIIQTLVKDAASGKTPAKPRVPVTLDAAGHRVDGPQTAPLPSGFRDSVVAAVEKVLGEKAARGEDLTAEDIRAHGPELAGELIGAVLGESLPKELSVPDGEGRKISLDLDLANIFGALVNKKKEGA